MVTIEARVFPCDLTAPPSEYVNRQDPLRRDSNALFDSAASSTTDSFGLLTTIAFRFGRSRSSYLRTSVLQFAVVHLASYRTEYCGTFMEYHLCRTGLRKLLRFICSHAQTHCHHFTEFLKPVSVRCSHPQIIHKCFLKAFRISAIPKLRKWNEVKMAHWLFCRVTNCGCYQLSFDK